MSSESLENLWFPCNELPLLDPLEKSSGESMEENDTLDLICNSVTGTCGSFSAPCFQEQSLNQFVDPQTSTEILTARGSSSLDNLTFPSSEMEISGAAGVFGHDQRDKLLEDAKHQSEVLDEKAIRSYGAAVGGRSSLNECSEMESLKSFAFENIEQVRLGEDELEASIRDFGALCSQNDQTTDAWRVAPSHRCSSDAAGHMISTTTRSDALQDVSGASSRHDSSGKERTRYTQKPPTTAGITLEDLKAVFHLHRPEAERRLNLKRTTFSNLSRHYGISKWPFRTLRDADNRILHNEKLIVTGSLSRDRKSKIQTQQRRLRAVKALMYEEPCLSKDSNTLSTLLKLVESREQKSEFR
jgi:RWP-RK domain